MIKTKKQKSPFEGMHVVFLTPTLSKCPASEFANSMRDTAVYLRELGIRHTWLSFGGWPYLDDVRNRLLTRAFDGFPDATDFFWLDDDIGWSAEDVVRVLIRPEEVVAGIYPKKEPKINFPCTMLKDADTGDFIRHEGMLAADMVPTGFLRFKRSVVEKMKDLRPRYLSIISGQNVEVINFFRTGPLWPDRVWYGEDPAFCREWRELGGDIWVIPDIKFTHRGTNLWSATMSDHLEGFLSPAQKEAAE
jgi:hypothetical protein